MICEYCHKRIKGDYSIDKNGRFLHPICFATLNKIKARNRKLRYEQKVQKRLDEGVYYLDA